MSRDIYFHAERRTSEGWGAVVVPDVEGGDTAAYPGEFGWMKEASRADELFFGEDALFPFIPGAAIGSPVLEKLASAWMPGAEGAWQDDRRPAWIAVPDLFVETWADPTAVLVAAAVPRALAPVFGNGAGALPRAELLSLGWTDGDIEALLAKAGLTDAAIDWDGLARGGKIARIPPEYLIEVTWRTSVAALLGSGLANAFVSLAGLGGAEDLRVVALVA